MFHVIPFKTQARNYKKAAAFLRHKLGNYEAQVNGFFLIICFGRACLYTQTEVYLLFISLTMAGIINWGLEAVNFYLIIFFFMFREKPMDWPWPTRLLWAFWPCGLFSGGFFGFVGFFVPIQRGSGSNPVS